MLISELDTALTSNGDTARLVGLTYPDMILGDDVFPGGDQFVLASESVLAFDSFINPTSRPPTPRSLRLVRQRDRCSLRQGLHRGNHGGDTGTWNLTTGVYTGPTTKFLPFGKTVPDSVAEVCKLTYYCSIAGDIHPDTKGYPSSLRSFWPTPGIYSQLHPTPSNRSRTVQCGTGASRPTPDTFPEPWERRDRLGNSASTTMAIPIQIHPVALRPRNVKNRRG